MTHHLTQHVEKTCITHHLTPHVEKTCIAHHLTQHVENTCMTHHLTKRGGLTPTLFIEVCAPIQDSKRSYIYSQTCITRSRFGRRKSDLIRQMTS
jgi:hypothetical protein